MRNVLWGSFLLIRDGSTANQITGIAVALFCLVCLVALIVRPRPGTVVLAGVGLAFWLILGLLGAGIDV
jgi:hypothetical protein